MCFHSQFWTRPNPHLTPLKVKTVVYFSLIKPSLSSLAVMGKFVTGGMLCLKKLLYAADSSCFVDLGHEQTLTYDNYITCRLECAIKDTALCYTFLELNKK